MREFLSRRHECCVHAVLGGVILKIVTINAGVARSSVLSINLLLLHINDLINAKTNPTKVRDDKRYLLVVSE